MPAPDTEQPLKKMTNKQLGMIIGGTLFLTFLLLFGINKLLSRATKATQTLDSPAPTVEPIATDDPTIPVDPANIPTPEPTATLTPKPTASPTPKPSTTPTASASAAPTTTVPITNVGGQDGWEDNNATASASQDIRVGRTASSTIRGFVGFDIGSIPKTSHVTSATLRIYQSSVTGNPYSIGGSITVDHMDYGGDITSDDYSSSALASGIGTISSNGTTEWKTLDVTSRVADDLSKHTSSQFRLRFTTETAGGDDVALFSSKSSGYDSNPPQLVVSYY